MDEMLKKHLQVEFDNIKKTAPDFVAELEKYLNLEEEPFGLHTANMRLMAQLLRDRLEHIDALLGMEQDWKSKT